MTDKSCMSLFIFNPGDQLIIVDGLSDGASLLSTKTLQPLTKNREDSLTWL